MNGFGLLDTWRGLVRLSARYLFVLHLFCRDSSGSSRQYRQKERDPVTTPVQEEGIHTGETTNNRQGSIIKKQVVDVDVDVSQATQNTSSTTHCHHISRSLLTKGRPYHTATMAMLSEPSHTKFNLTYPPHPSNASSLNESTTYVSPLPPTKLSCTKTNPNQTLSSPPQSQESSPPS